MSSGGLSEPPEEIADSEWLIRRVMAGARVRSTGEVRPAAFRLRLSREERALSFYREAYCELGHVLADAPPGSGAVRLLAGDIRRLGFSLSANPIPGTTHGAAHVLATLEAVPQQLPVEALNALASISRWLALPDD
jgi:hypothetical protein